MNKEWDKIFNVTANNFEQLALEIFQYQYQYNSVYKTYVDTMKFNPQKINTLSRIPFLPIQFFKTHAIKTTDFDPVCIFESSGTMQTVNSHHYVKDIDLYRQSFTKAFQLFYGPIDDWCIIGLLPSYLERKNSSLVLMVDELVRKSNHSESGFYLYEYDKLYETLRELEEKKQKTLLIGVTFAVIDFAEKYSFPLRYTTIMETGGMKGRREDITRQELHELLRTKFSNESIHSEYGMTELLSQAYSKQNGIFCCPPWMKVLVRDEEDPLEVLNAGLHNSQHDSYRLANYDLQSSIKGLINVIDLANVFSCSFIATDDAGKLYNDGSFEVIGRVDNSDIRGCSLMAL